MTDRLVLSRLVCTALAAAAANHHDNRTERHTAMRTKPRRPRCYEVTVHRQAFGTEYDRMIGIAFEHQDGDGINIFLDAFPLDEQLTLQLLAIQYYGGGTDNVLLPLDWPPDDVGTPVKALRKSRKVRIMSRKRSTRK